MMKTGPIKTHRGYLRTLKQIERLMRAKRNTPDGDRLDVLVTLVEAWEAKHYKAIKHPRHTGEECAPAAQGEGDDASRARDGRGPASRIYQRSRERENKSGA